MLMIGFIWEAYHCAGQRRGGRTSYPTSLLPIRSSAAWSPRRQATRQRTGHKIEKRSTDAIPAIVSRGEAERLMSLYAKQRRRKEAKKQKAIRKETKKPPPTLFVCTIIPGSLGDLPSQRGPGVEPSRY
jgi:hypothetical protein